MDKAFCVDVCVCVWVGGCGCGCGCGCDCGCESGWVGGRVSGLVGVCVCVFVFVGVGVGAAVAVVLFIPVLCVHIHPFSSTETVPKTKSSLVEVLVFCPPKLLAKVKQFVSSFRSSLEEVYRKLPLAVFLPPR